MNSNTDSQLLFNLIELLPKNVNQLINNLVNDQVIGQPLTHLRQTVEEFVDQEIIGKVDQNTNRFNCIDNCDKCEAILDFVWEQINCCQWDQVLCDFRYIYGYISLIKSLLKVYETLCLYVDPDFDYSFNNKLIALKTLDMGLIMSPSIENNILSKFATIIHKSISSVKFEPNFQSLKGIKRKFEQKYEKISENMTLSCNYEKCMTREKNLDIEDFREKYFNKKVPVIITDFMNDWPAMSSRKWTIDYILKVCAYRTVPIEIGSKYTDEDWSQKLMTIKEFIDEYILNSNEKRVAYLAQHNLFEQIEELRSDITIPDFCCLSEHDMNVDINAWFGPNHTVSPLHFDPKDNLLVQVMGTKYIRLYSNETPKEFIYPNECKLLFNTSQVDLENVNEDKFPLFKKIDDYYECVLKEGEMLYIPKKYWHFVKSLSTSFSISFWWK